MVINLSPVRMGEQLAVSKQGDILTINGEAFDFSRMPDGASLPGEAIESNWFVGQVERTNGDLVLTLVLPHGQNAPESTRFPQPIIMAGDGVVALPIYDLPAPLESSDSEEPQQ